MKLLVVGATGALGRDVVAEALARRHATAALVRDRRRAALPEGVELVEGDVLEPQSLVAATRRRDAVICALGTPSPRRSSTLLERGTEYLAAAMGGHAVRRLVCVTLLGTGSSQANGSFMYRHLILRVLAPMVPDKEAQEQVVRGSELEWTLVRPPRFVAGEARGDLQVIRNGDRRRVGHVVRQDLAAFLIDCATKDMHVGEAVVVGS